MACEVHPAAVIAAGTAAVAATHSCLTGSTTLLHLNPVRLVTIVLCEMKRVVLAVAARVKHHGQSRICQRVTSP
jgi:hypothetical protein